MLDELINNFTLFNLFVGILLYILAIFIGVCLKSNQNIIVPAIFGLMYGIYLYQVKYRCYKLENT